MNHLKYSSINFILICVEKDSWFLIQIHFNFIKLKLNIKSLYNAYYDINIMQFFQVRLNILMFCESAILSWNLSFCSFIFRKTPCFRLFSMSRCALLAISNRFKRIFEVYRLNQIGKCLMLLSKKFMNMPFLRFLLFLFW